MTMKARLLPSFAVLATLVALQSPTPCHAASCNVDVTVKCTRTENENVDCNDFPMESNPDCIYKVTYTYDVTISEDDLRFVSATRYRDESFLGGPVRSYQEKYKGTLFPYGTNFDASETVCEDTRGDTTFEVKMKNDSGETCTTAVTYEHTAKGSSGYQGNQGNQGQNNNGGISQAELSTEFVRKPLKMKQCRWIASLSDTRRSDICGSRASARAVCAGSCSNEGCSRSPSDGSFSSNQCESEWTELYRHSKRKVKTCGWLRDSPKKSAICKKIDSATDDCPTVCNE